MGGKKSGMVELEGTRKNDSARDGTGRLVLIREKMGFDGTVRDEKRTDGAKRGRVGRKNAKEKRERGGKGREVVVQDGRDELGQGV